MSTKSAPPKPSARSAAEIATLALFLIGGTSTYVDTEDVAVQAYELAPEKFAWRKHRDRIDLEAARVALRHASEGADGGWVTGGAASGWMLTPAGIDIAWRMQDDISPKSVPRRGSEDARLVAERERMRTTAAWAKFQSGKGEDVSIHDFRALLRVNEYFPPHKVRERYAMLENATTGEAGLGELLVLLRERFGREMGL